MKTFEEHKEDQGLITEWRRDHYICGCKRVNEDWCPKHKGGLGE